MLKIILWIICIVNATYGVERGRTEHSNATKGLSVCTEVQLLWLLLREALSKVCIN
jgi:hypothetical protein